jgi:hypothetical protein
MPRESSCLREREIEAFFFDETPRCDKSLTTTIKKWLIKSAFTYPNLNTEALDINLQQLIFIWLEKLERSRDFRNVSAGIAFARRVLSIIEFANLDEEYQKILKVVLEGVTASCQDGGVLSLNTLELEKKIRQSKSLTQIDLIELLKGAFAATLLEEKAVDIIVSRDLSRVMSDAVEILLALQISLKGRLNLPFDCFEMDYFKAAQLSDEDIDHIELHIRSKIEDHQQFCDFLIEQVSWREYLQQYFEKEYFQLQQYMFDKLEKVEKEKETLLSDQYVLQSTLLKKEYSEKQESFFKKKTLILLKSAKRVKSLKRKRN